MTTYCRCTIYWWYSQSGWSHLSTHLICRTREVEPCCIFLNYEETQQSPTPVHYKHILLSLTVLVYQLWYNFQGQEYCQKEESIVVWVTHRWAASEIRGPRKVSYDCEGRGGSQREIVKMIAFPVQDIQPRGTVQSFIPSYNSRCGPGGQVYFHGGFDKPDV